MCNIKKIMISISKYIPFNIRVKSLYWVRKEKEIDKELEQLFGLIDTDEYSDASIMLEQLREKWLLTQQVCPVWFYEYISQFSKADAMLNFLDAKSKK